MTLAELVATLTGIIASEPASGPFDALRAGGFDAGATVEVQACPRPLDPGEIEGETLICGVVVVPEDHDAPEGGNTVGLEFVLLRAETTYPAPDPVLYLHGGPGGGNLPGGARWVSNNFAPFRATRDIVAFDQRAAGISSDSVECVELLTGTIDEVLVEGVGLAQEAEGGGMTASDFFVDCVEELEAEGVDLSKYNTRQNALDAQMVMRALGYEDWNLFGASYGTKLALEILRTAPEGVRSVVLDSVAPPWLKLYENLGQRRSEMLERLVADCAADAACDAAYPDLGTVITEVYERAEAGELTWHGEPFPVLEVINLPVYRNAPGNQGKITQYLPALYYELYRGGETPTIDLVYDTWGMFPPSDPEGDLRAMAEGMLDEAGMALLDEALTAASISDDAQTLVDSAVTQLREQVRRDRELGPLAALLDAELSAALPDLGVTDEAARALLRDYAALAAAAPSREILSGFVTTHFEGPRLSRLTALTEAMSEAEIAAFFDEAGIAVELATFESIQIGFDRSIYYCQEDVPFNTLEGHYATTDALAFPWDEDVDPLAEGMFAACDAFEPSPRDNWHEVVVSDVPTIALGGGGDMQTSASWAEAAIEGLSNGRFFFIEEAGHITFRFQPCVRDLARAFYDDPMRPLDDSCERAAASPPFHIADWAAEAEKVTSGPGSPRARAHPRATRRAIRGKARGSRGRERCRRSPMSEGRPRRRERRGSPAGPRHARRPAP